MPRTLQSYFSLIFFSLICSCSISLFPQKIEARGFEKKYQYYCDVPSDINEHLPYLRFLAKKCTTIAQIGAETLAPTYALLQGLSENENSPKDYLVIDLEFPAGEAFASIKKLARKQKINLTFWPVNDLHIDLEPTDMLYLDPAGRHTYCHLTYELETFAPRIGKYICLHNTVGNWENDNDSGYQGDYAEYPPSYDRDKKGVRQAISDFIEKHPEWSLLKDRQNNNGLTVLKRNNEDLFSKRSYDSKVEYYIKNKIILCTGPSLSRYDQLKKMTEADMQLVPFKKIFLSTNDMSNMKILFNDLKPVSQYIGDRYKTLDCLNCIFTTLKNAVNDPEVKDSDIILFKHESVFINDMCLFKKAVRKMIDGANMVVRNTFWGIGTGEFFAKVSAIREIVKNYPIIEELPTDEYAKMNGVWNAETYFNAYLVKKIPNPYIINLQHSHWKFTELGVYHFASGKLVNTPADDWHCPWWNKQDYNELYK